MPEPIPIYKVGIAFENANVSMLWPVFQCYGPRDSRRSRTVGYFTSLQDAQVYVATFNRFKKTAAKADGSRKV